MMKSFGLFALALAVSAVGSEVSARELVTYAPSSVWEVEWASDSCHLKRRFGTPDDGVDLIVSQYGYGPGVEVALAGHPIARSNGDVFPLDYTFGGQTKRTEKAGFVALLGEREAVVKFGTLPVEYDSDAGAWRPDPAAEKQIVSIAIDQKRGDDFVIATGPMDKPLKALRDCSLQLLASWNLDADKHLTLARDVTPRSNPGRWLDESSYKKVLGTLDLVSDVRFQIMVDAEGNATSCRVPLGSTETLDGEELCRLLMKKARFEPALDASGTPIASYWSSMVRFTTG